MQIGKAQAGKCVCLIADHSENNDYLLKFRPFTASARLPWLAHAVKIMFQSNILPALDRRHA
ncbi:hypothetical protein ASF69_02850 [Rhizobium sp. Leaf311]|jgi:hypothetical protein|nr:hypothetical protein ASF69_02850 [Rhizobium sp. Leaf311]